MYAKYTHFEIKSANTDDSPITFLERNLVPWAVLLFSLLFWAAIMLSIFDWLEKPADRNQMISAVESMGNI